MSETVRIAAVQYSAASDVLENCRRIEPLIAQAAQEGARWVVLPEMWSLRVPSSGSDLRLQNAREHEAMLLQKISDWARRYSVVLVAGSIFRSARTAGKLRNSCMVFSPEGKELARYDKIHLFDLPSAGLLESKQVEAGDQLAIVELDGWRVGLCICYDIRFPKLFEQLRRAGAEIILVPSAFTAVTGKAHWELLARARAVENQCYVLAVNQWGEAGPGTACWGHTMAVDPWGEIIKQVEEGDAVMLCEMVRKKMENVRSRMPLQDHARAVEKLELQEFNFSRPISD